MRTGDVIQNAIDVIARQQDEDGKMIKSMNYSEYHKDNRIYNPVGALVLSLGIEGGDPADLLDPLQQAMFTQCIDSMARGFLQVQYADQALNYKRARAKAKDLLCTEGVPCNTDTEVDTAIVHYLSRAWIVPHTYDAMLKGQRHADTQQ